MVQMSVYEGTDNPSMKDKAPEIGVSPISQLPLNNSNGLKSNNSVVIMSQAEGNHDGSAIVIGGPDKEKVEDPTFEPTILPQADIPVNPNPSYEDNCGEETTESVNSSVPATPIHASTSSDMDSTCDQSEPSEAVDYHCSNPDDDKSSLSTHDCLLHPDYVALKNELEDNKKSTLLIQETVKGLQDLEASQAERISMLEQKVAQQDRELKLSQQEHELDVRSLATLRKETDTKIETLKKQFEQAKKEKEAMVMRYVTSEKELMEQKKEKESIEKKWKELFKENESVVQRLKVATAEKAKLSQLLETKNSESSAGTKEIEWLKEEINSRDIKIKWIQNKVKTEMDLHKDCPSKIEKLTQRVQQLEEEKVHAKSELQDYQHNKSNEMHLKEEQAKLILERYEHAEREAKFKVLQAKNAQLIEENNSLSLRVQNWEQEKFDYEQKLSRAREDISNYSNNVSSLQTKIVEFTTLNSQLKQERDNLESTCGEIERLRKSNEELLSEMASCQNREAEMLSFTQKLTTKNVQLQSEFSAVEAKATELGCEHEQAGKVMTDMKLRIASLEKELKSEQVKRAEESRLLAKQVAEKYNKVQELESSLEEYKGEISVLRNKHAVTVKELQRELQHCRKKLDQYESTIGSGSDSVCHGSRASSLSSLNDNSTHTTSNNFQVDVPPQVLVERIVRLQHEIARQKERLEFLEEHTGQLTGELQKKSRLLQNYHLREQAGALTPNTMDNNKAEVSKHGGIMSSLYGSKPTDDTMTLELSLEINHKLQAILEDTLLKNITLKENIDTLGEEIARLSKSRQS